MEVITDRPIYSNLTAAERQARREERKTKKAEKTEPNIFERALASGKQLLQSDYGKAVVGVGATKAQDWAARGTGAGTISGANPLNVTIETQAQREQQQALLVEQQKERSRKMVRNVIIGVVAVAILGTVTYFVVKARKGKKGTAKK
jgi:hypothetical protein